MLIATDARALTGNNLSGVPIYGRQLLEHLIVNDPTNEYVIFSNSKKNKIEKGMLAGFPNVNFIERQFPNKILNASLALLNRPYLTKLLPKKPDVFISLNPYYGTSEPSVKTIEIVHDCTPQMYPEFFSLKMRVGVKFFRMTARLAKASAIIVPSATTAQDVEHYFPNSKGKIHIVNPGVSPAFEIEPTTEEIAHVKNKYNLPDKFILFLGTIEPRKNLETLIEAYTLFASEQKNNATELVIAGTLGWKTKEIVKAWNNSKVKNKIKFLGYVQEEDKKALYAAAKLFLFPSFYEGFGLPVLEALSLGVPTIASATSSMAELFGSAALLIDPLRPLELAKIINEYIVDSEQIHPRQTRIELAKKFNWEDSSKKILNIINAI